MEGHGERPEQLRAWRPGYAGLTTSEEDQERESQGIEGLSRS